MTVVNPKSISGINSITMASGSDNLLTIHTTNTTERVRINSSGDVIVGSGITVSPDGNIFATGVTTSTTFVGALTGAASQVTATANGDNTSYRVPFTSAASGSASIYTDTSDGMTYNPSSGALTINGVFTSGSVSSGAISGSTGTFTGAVTLTDGVSNGLKIGAGEDLVLQHNGTNSFIDNNTGDLYIQTTGSGDDILIESADDITLKVAGSETAIQATGDGAVELYHNNVKKIETATEGVVIPSGGGNCLRVFGQNTYHATSALVIGQNSTTVSQLRAYGPDTSTNGEINFRSSRSDGSNSVNMTYNGNLQFDSGYGIDFSATSDYTGAGSGTPSELFDDYEEGTWTPRYQTSNGNWSGSMSNQDGSYTKVGNLVHIRFRIHWGSVGGSGNFRITALPFTVANTASDEGGGVTIGWRSGFNYEQVVSFFKINNQQIQFGYISGSAPYGSFDISVGALASTGYVYCSGTYGAA